MKITKLRIKAIVEAAAKSTKKYDDNKALTPKQGKSLPDNLQKAIISKAGGDLDETDELVGNKTDNYYRGLDDGREDQAAEAIGGQIYGPDDPSDQIYMAGYNDGMYGIDEVSVSIGHTPAGYSGGSSSGGGSSVNLESRQSISSTTLREATHRCMDGSMVHPDSDRCYTDIVDRIEDAEFHRNSHTCGTENRIYYNGLLKGLRKKRNRLQKSLNI